MGHERARGAACGVESERRSMWCDYPLFDFQDVRTDCQYHNSDLIHNRFQEMDDLIRTSEVGFAAHCVPVREPESGGECVKSVHQIHTPHLTQDGPDGPRRRKGERGRRDELGNYVVFWHSAGDSLLLHNRLGGSVRPHLRADRRRPAAVDR